LRPLRLRSHRLGLSLQLRNPSRRRPSRSNARSRLMQRACTARSASNFALNAKRSWKGNPLRVRRLRRRQRQRHRLQRKPAIQRRAPRRKT